MRMSFGMRIVASVLVFVLFVSCLGVMAEDIYTESDLSDFKENVRFLTAFDLVDSKGREAATTVKRADFAEIMIKYLGYDNMIYDGELFSDVADRKSAVYTMVQLGLINGYPDGSFRPDDNVMYEEVVKVLVTALGYHMKAEAEGGYPHGYLMCASTTKLTEDTDGGLGSILTYFDFVQMLVNGMSVDLMEQSISSDNVTYTVTPGNTWLKQRFMAEKRRGIVTGTKGVDLNEQSKTWETTITVDNVIYKIEEDCEHLVGCYVEFYPDNENYIRYIKELDNTKFVFTAEEIQSYSDKTYEVYDIAANKERKYTLASDAYVVFNGSSAESLTIEDMIPKYGTVTLINNDKESAFDVVIIESYDIYVVKNVDAEDKRIYYENSDGEFLDFAKAERLSIADSTGKEILFEKIPASAVLRVSFSKDGTAAKIIISQSRVNGTVTKIVSDGADSSVFIDDVPYKIAQTVFPLEKCKIGMSGTFRLDSEGLIVKFEESADKYSVGWLLSAGIEEGFNQPLKLRVFDVSGQILVLNTAKKVNIDGLKGRNYAEVQEILKKGTNSIMQQMIRFKQNASGEVYEIDTPYNKAPALGDGYLSAKPENGESEYGFRLIYSGSLGYYARLNTLGGRINVSGNTPIINIFGDDERDWKATTVAGLTDTRGYNIKAYSFGTDERFASVIFISESMSGGNARGVISGVETVLDIDGIPEYEFVVQTQTHGTLHLRSKENVAKPYKADASNTKKYAIEVGDIVECTFTGNNADSFAMIYKYSTGELPAGYTSSPGIGPGEAHERYSFGTVYSQEKGYINITNVDLAGGAVPTQEQLESHCWSAFTMMKVEEVRGEVKVTNSVTAADILDYKAAGSAASKAFVVTNWEFPRFIVIYE